MTWNLLWGVVDPELQCTGSGKHLGSWRVADDPRGVSLHYPRDGLLFLAPRAWPVFPLSL